MRSPVNWALLGLVIQRPSYGYELVQRFERTYKGALELSSPSQIYTGLDTLVRKALVEEAPAEEAACDADDVVRQPKPHYRATAAGVSGYRQWMVAQPQDERRRSRLFIRQLAVLAPQDALAIVEQYEQGCLQRARRPTPKRPDDRPNDLATRLLDEEERLGVDARLAWVEYARQELNTLVSGPTAVKR